MPTSDSSAQSHDGPTAMSDPDLDIDSGVSIRQCLGVGFIRQDDYVERARKLLDGRMRVSPHPEWAAEDLCDWTADPFSSRNWQFQHHALRWISPARHLAMDGDRDAREFWMSTAQSWIRHNPPEAPASQFSWIDMADGLRAQELVFGWPLAETPDEKQALLSALETHGTWLADPEHLSEGNHALHQDLGLFVLASFLRRREWQDLAVRRLAELFEGSFDENGANDEGSVEYHRLNLAWWTSAWDRVAMEDVEVPRHVQQTLTRAADFLAHATRPDGFMMTIGDTHLKRVEASGRPEIDYVATLGDEGESPSSTTVVAPNGFILGRSGWGGEGRSYAEETSYSLRYGPQIRSHQHEDRGGITFFSGGRDWITDPGSYNYEPKDPFRRHLRSRQAHNLVVVDDREYAPAGHVRLERAEVSDHAHDYAVVDRNYEGVALRRRLVYLPGLDLGIVTDHFDADKQVTARQLWQLNPGVRARLRDSAVELQDGDSSLSLAWLGNGERPVVRYADDSSPRGWVSRAWGKKEPGGVAEVAKSARSGVFTAVFGESTKDTWSVVSSRATPKSAWMRILRFGRVWSITISEDQVVISEDEQRTALLGQGAVSPAVVSGRDDRWIRQRFADLEDRVARASARAQQPPAADVSTEPAAGLAKRVEALEKQLSTTSKALDTAVTEQRQRIGKVLPHLPQGMPRETVLGSLTLKDVVAYIDDPLFLYELWTSGDPGLVMNLGQRRKLSRALYQRGYYAHSLEMLRGIAVASGKDSDRRAVEVRASELAMLSGELVTECAAPAEGSFVAETGRILHVVGKALPETQTGYTLRTHYLAQAQSEKGYDVHVMRQAGASVDALGESPVVQDGVTYHLPEGPARGTETWATWLQANTDALRAVVEEVRPSLLHCHSDYINQLIARPVADAYGLPLIYESRGFWEESWLSRVETSVGRPLEADYQRYGYPDAYTLRHERENQARASSDHVTTLAEVMREHIIDRGEDPERISVTPNGVLPSDFPVVEPDLELKDRLDIPREVPVIGYITSVVEYEGIDTLVEAFAQMMHQGVDARLLLVGDGPVRKALQEQAKNLGIAAKCCFTGRIPHEEVLDYYSIIDLFVVPRKNRAVCRLVTPLKPFEAFSTGRAVVVSDVDALREIAGQSGAAATFRAEDPNNLAQLLSRLLEDPQARAEMSEKGAAWVRAERSWQSIADRYDEPYRRLGVRFFDPVGSVDSDECVELRTGLKRLSRDEALRFLYVHGQSDKNDLVNSADAVMAEGWGGDGFARERIDADYDWSAIADQDRTWQMHMHSWEFMVPVLGAWGLTGSDHYMEWAVRRALRWNDMFVNIDAESMAWYDMALAYRSTTLQALVRGAAQCAAVSDEDFASLIRLSLKQRDAHWEGWSFNPRNNHGYYSAVSQVVLARGIPDLRGMEALRHQGNDRLRLMAETQFNADGGHVEHSPDYHRMLLSSFEGAIAVDAIDDPEVLTRVRKAADVLGWMVLPNGRILQMGDSPERDMRGDRSAISPSTNWILTRGQKGTAPSQDALMLPESGYAFIRPLKRNGDDALSKTPYLAMTAGFHSRTHKHCDDQSLVWMEDGQEILIDGGRYRYGELLSQDSELRKKGFYYADPVRQYMESCAAHSTLSMDGDMQDRRRTPYGSGLQDMIAHNDGSFTIRSEVPQNGWTARREVNYMPGRRLDVRDTVTMADEDEHILHTWFLLDGGLSLHEKEGGLVLGSPRWEAALRLNRKTAGGAAEDLRIRRDQREGTIRGVRSRRDRELGAAWSLEYRMPFRGSVETVTVFEFETATPQKDV